MAKNKKLGAKFCKKNGANIIIMDDGLQSKDIKKDFKILVKMLNINLVMN